MIDLKLQTDPSDAAVLALEQDVWEALQRGVVFLWQQVQEALNVPNTGVRRKHRTRKTKSGRAATHTVYPHPSRPGEPPRKRTGWLQRNVNYELDRKRLAGRIGIATNAKYGAFLELGTRRMQPRPFLLSTIRANMDAARAIMRGGTP